MPFFTLNPPKFRGFVLDDAFDKVVISTGGLGNSLAIDNLYIGTSVPAPAVLTALFAALFDARHRRRS
ncbi:MAG: hypothetical protein SGJ09_01550 [Phycisphaerae bacterium]|nr:hypothetical protein [Phycisphaerae bacterium]